MHWSSGARAHLQYYIIQLLTSIGLKIRRPFLIISPREVVLVSLFVCDRFNRSTVHTTLSSHIRAIGDKKADTDTRTVYDDYHYYLAINTIFPISSRCRALVTSPHQTRAPIEDYSQFPKEIKLEGEHHFIANTQHYIKHKHS